jgi:hypothetical protein
MKQTFIRLQVNSLAKKSKAIRSSISFEHALSFGIVYTTDDKRKHDIVKDLCKQLEAKGNFEFLFPYYTKKDFSFFGQLQSHDAEKFCAMPFDYLYCLDEVPQPMVLYILAKSKTKCRVGKYAEGMENFFELMVEEKGNVQQLKDNMLKYTAVLK